MSTINISLTSDQVKLVNALTRAHDFASRSEFFRALLRLVSRKPDILQVADDLVLAPPSTRSISTIIGGMRATKKYPEKFLKSLERGMKASDYFTK